MPVQIKFYTALHIMSGDGWRRFSTMMSDAMMAQIAGSKIPKELAKQFDAEAKNIAGLEGVLHPEAAEQLRNVSDMKKRAAIMKL